MYFIISHFCKKSSSSVKIFISCLIEKSIDFSYFLWYNI